MRSLVCCSNRRVLVVSCFVVMLLASPQAHAAMHHKVLYRFANSTDGGGPSSGLLLDASGHLYGTAYSGGDLNCSNGVPSSGCGVVFELATSGGGKWQERVLYAFQGGTDGIGPSGNLVLDASGNLYGTTFEGGSTSYGCDNGFLGCGIVFELSPHANGTWTETVLYRFKDGSDGGVPQGLISDASGNLYGVTQFFGSVIYELSPPQQKGAPWTETTLYDMGYITWAAPELVFDGNGDLHGSWYPNGCCGGVFELAHVGGSWQYRDLYDFLGGGNGGEPQSGIIFDKKGNMYGTGIAGGNDWGIAFELKRVGGKWTQVMLHNFCSRNNCADGASPDAPLVFDQDGNLFGTTVNGGAGLRCDPDCGVAFELSPAERGKWKETVLHRFQGGLDGDTLYEGVTLDGKGTVFGVTTYGGTSSGPGYGTVFELTP